MQQIEKLWNSFLDFLVRCKILENCWKYTVWTTRGKTATYRVKCQDGDIIPKRGRLSLTNVLCALVGAALGSALVIFLY